LLKNIQKNIFKLKPVVAPSHLYLLKVMNQIFHQQIPPFRHGVRAFLQSFGKKRKASYGGFSLIELLIVIGILGTLAGIAIPVYSYYVDKARITEAIAEIRIMEKEILAYQMKHETLPNDLTDIGRGNLEDPWGNPYQYLDFEDVHGKGKIRKYKSQDLNSDFDLYSMGKDGASNPPLSANASRDDIVRAGNGKYVGLASEY